MDKHERKIRVLFLCKHNQARSQMAEALLRKLGGDHFEVYSAGSDPTDELHPLTARLLADYGMDVGKLHPKPLNQFRDEQFDYIITIAGERGGGPTFPGDPEQIFWLYSDPAAVEGEAEQNRTFRATFAELETRIREFVNVNHHLNREREREERWAALMSAKEEANR